MRPYSPFLVAACAMLGGCSLLFSPPDEFKNHCIAWGSPQSPELLANLPLSALLDRLKERGISSAWKSAGNGVYILNSVRVDPLSNLKHTIDMQLVLSDTPPREPGVSKPFDCGSKTLTVTRILADGEALNAFMTSSFLIDVLRDLIDSQTRTAEAEDTPAQQVSPATESESTSQLANQSLQSDPSLPTDTSQPGYESDFSKSLPSQFHGRWSTDRACGDVDSVGIEGDRIDFYEAHGAIERVTVANEGIEYVGRVTFEGEGDIWTRTISFKRDGESLIMTDKDGPDTGNPSTWVRCR